MKRLISVLILLLLGGLFGCSSIENDSSSSPSLPSPAFDNAETQAGEIPHPASEPPDGEFVSLPVENSPEAAAEPETESAKENNAELEVSDIDFSQPGVYEITYNVIYSVDVNGDSVMERISFNEKEYEYGLSIGLKVNDVDYSALNIWTGNFQAYVIRKYNGSVGVIVSGQDDTDYDNTYIYRFNDIDAILIESIDYQVDCVTIDSVTLYGVDFIFGNWNVSIDCTINDDFSITYLNDGLRKINSGVSDYLDTKMDISIQCLIGGDYEDSVLQAGSRIFPENIWYTNNKICLMFKTEDGSAGRLFAEYVEDGLSVNGIDEYDVFDNIIYAGP